MRFHKEVYDWSSGGKALQRNAYYVGHALKNDLTKIEWCTELLSKRGMKDRELDIIRSSVAHLKDFISRTRLYSQQITLTEAPCNIEELFQKVIAGLPQIKERHISVLVRACDSEPLLCDRAHLEEVLYNLVTNAADAMPDGGVVELSYRNQASKGKAVISVTDHGCGIQEDRIRLLFEPCFTTKRNHQNMGLGLYYCWNVMTAHKGSIRVDSKVDCGSTFFLWFPVRRKNMEGGKYVHTIQVLAVDDDPDFRYLLEQVISGQPDTQLTAVCKNGTEALQIALCGQPDIVLMDLELTGSKLNGVEAARRIRMETNAKIIILTGDDAPETTVRASVQAFASGYVLKSQFSLLLPTIRETAAGPTPQSNLIFAALLQRLTNAERSVCEQMLGREVELSSASKTIANQQTSVLRKLGLNDKQALRHVLSVYIE